jgi:hypothetical protein
VTTFAPGVSVHRIGGHTAGLQCVRVYTQRGWVVLAPLVLAKYPAVPGQKDIAILHERPVTAAVQ